MDLSLMKRRKATLSELQEGERQMLEAHERLQRDAEESGFLAIEAGVSSIGREEKSEAAQVSAVGFGRTTKVVCSRSVHRYT